MLNKVFLIGRAGKDPELKYTPSGAAVATFTMATSETWKSKEGKKEEKTEWHNIVAWRKLAEICGQYVKKGDLLHIEGKITTRSWEDRDGNKRTTTEIVANEMKMLGGGKKQDAPPPSGEDDIPF
jgi:single-strand DNA-binding protein